MTLKHILFSGAIILAFNAGAQTVTDSAVIMEYDDSALVSPYPEEDYYGTMDAMEVAPAVPEYYEYNSANKFKYNKKIKPEIKPDKKAFYSMGTSALLTEISNGLNVPYGYGAESSYVIIQFVVGKDSALYNPEILFTGGAQHSINATDVIEKLMYQFSPATKNGKPVDSVITIPVHFVRRNYNTDYETYH